MRKSFIQIVAVAAVTVLGLACDRTPRSGGEPGAEGTAGRPGSAASKASTVLTGCLEKNLSTGQFEIVLEGDEARRAGSPNAGMQPGHDRLALVKEGDVELNQYVGKRVTLEGALGAGQPVTDAGTRSYAAGKGADRSQTRSREGDSRLMTVTAVTNVADTCELEKR